MHTEAEKNSAVISSDRVEGTAVFDRGGKNIGHVDHVLIEKRGGQATEAVLSVGGFLGMGDEKHCVPWSKLDYDTDLGGYHLNIDEMPFAKGRASLPRNDTRPTTIISGLAFTNIMKQRR
jgi:sporulation protein YlmC with PRC-barrel domain